MSGRRNQSMATYDKEPATRGRCTTALCASWKIITCIFQHVILIGIVVGYCLVGAYTFSTLEKDHELKIKGGIRNIRDNLTETIWDFTRHIDVLREDNWTKQMEKELEKFEKDILKSMKKDGWDGTEDDVVTQWTFAGALFYSIIVITTIGYGHIAPKTDLGKITTIFYAILGIPLMLLCLSTIGDIMASSFRFIYWKMCCFVCTRTSRRSNARRMRRQGTIRHDRPPSYRSSGHSSQRRSVRANHRSAEFMPYAERYNDPNMYHAHSDTELRYYNPTVNDTRYNTENERDTNQRSSRNRNRFNRDNKNRFRDRHTIERERNISRFENRQDDEFPQVANHRRSYSTRHVREQSSPRDLSRRNNFKRNSEVLLTGSLGRNQPAQRARPPAMRARSLDPRGLYEFEKTNPNCKTPIFCNRYAIDEFNRELRGISLPNNRTYQDEFDDEDDEPRNQHPISRTGRRSMRQSTHQRPTGQRAQSMPRPYYQPTNEELEPSPSPPYRRNNNNHLCPPEPGYEMQPIRKHKRSPRNNRSSPMPPSPRIMSPMGFAVHRQARIMARGEDDWLYEEDWDSVVDLPTRVRPVPIWLCVFLVIGYILAGASLFHHWENWDYLDSAYFCFITLTTIGFGDFVPAQNNKKEPTWSIAMCSIYLLFGIALLAMSFNLVQEEFIAKVKNVARQLGILKEEEMDD